MNTSRRGFWSPISWLLVTACILCAGVVVAGAGPSPKHVDEFLGLWEGIDPLDGSPVRLSLSDVDDDGVLDHTLQEDFYTVCFNLGPNYARGRGVVTGTATVASKDVLEVVSELTCISDNNISAPLGVGTNQYTLRSHERVLVLPAFGSSPPIVLHHIAP